jgi:hypothetical protein
VACLWADRRVISRGVGERCLEGVNDIGLTWNRVQFLVLENSVATSRLNILYNVTKNNFVHFNHVLIHKTFLSYIQENIQRGNRTTVTA